MCKVMVIPGIPQNKTKQVDAFVRVARLFLTENDDDGFGYAALGHSGQLFGEKWLDPKDAFKSTLSKDKYSYFGAVEESYSSILVHSRAATCEKNITNAHPFIRDNTALIHNGMIFNADELTNLTSTCDSEVILNEYCEMNVADNPENMQLVADKLDGWYACGVISKTSDNRWIVDIFKDLKTSLVAGYIEELGCMVYCTTKDILQNTADVFSYAIKKFYEIPADTLIRVDAVTGKYDKVTQFTSGRIEKQYANLLTGWGECTTGWDQYERECLYLDEEEFSDQDLYDVYQRANSKRGRGW